MRNQLQTFFISLLAPGLGYLQNGDKKSFYKVQIIFFSITICGAVFKLFSTYSGLVSIFVLLFAIYVFSIVRATFQAKQKNSGNQFSKTLKFCLTVSFVLITGLSFANRRTVLGFDIMSMNVPVMQPTVLENERFLVNTWAYKNSFPKRGDIVVHSFVGQRGLYLNRIIAIENDKIEIKNGIVFLNGQKLNESYVLTKNITKAESKNMKEVLVLKGHYFVMGDNRDASFGDSRFSGTIMMDNIIGRTTEIITSQNRSRIGKPLK